VDPGVPGGALMRRTARGLRAVSFVLVVTAALLAGTTFATQRQAHAFAPGVVVVMPSVAAAIPAGASAVGSAVAGTVVAVAGLWCAYGPGNYCPDVRIPWKHNDDHVPNGDMPASGGSPGGYWMTATTGGVCYVNSFSMEGCASGPGISAEQRTGSVTITWLTSSGSPSSGVNTRLICRQADGATTVTQVITDANGQATQYGSSCTGTYYPYSIANISSGYDLGTYYIGEPQDGTTADPSRRATPFSRCSNADGGFIMRRGNSFTYKDSQSADLPDIIPPPCPESHPNRTGFGTDTRPLTPDGEPDPDYQPAPLVPEHQWPTAPDQIIPQAYPQCIVPGACVLNRTPVPHPGPQTNPDGTNVPDPTRIPGTEDYCTWGPYNVPASECTDPRYPPTWAPQPQPGQPGTAPTPTAPGTSPNTAEPGTEPADGNEGCMSDIVAWNPISWVYIPAKCAIKWAAELKPETLTRVDTTMGRLSGVPPFSVLTSVQDWLAPIASLGQTCPDWSVSVAGSTHSVICDQGYTKKMHDNRSLFGVGMTLAMLGPFIWRVWHSAIPVLRVNRG
jgi:hypothetical protein